jgi:hypothetical protein
MNSSIERVKDILKQTGHEFPSLYTPFTPQSEAIRGIPEIRDAGAELVAAASQIISTMNPPPLTILNSSLMV